MCKTKRFPKDYFTKKKIQNFGLSTKITRGFSENSEVPPLENQFAIGLCNFSIAIGEFWGTALKKKLKYSQKKKGF